MSTLAPALALITFGVWETLLVVGVLMLLFGAKKLPMLARGLGTGIRNFKGEMQAPEKLEAPDDEENARRGDTRPEDARPDDAGQARAQDEVGRRP